MNITFEILTQEKLVRLWQKGLDSEVEIFTP